ncbi:MAG: epoxyqueuosine reductase QueH, partial [Lachnospiraceae bacterium]|nr:epoxyqueuosine reductase QueH [Lachnospiraceae bacterium]
MHACDIMYPMNQVNYQKKMDEILASEDTRTKRLLLQCCCAPCSSHCLTVLEGKISITAYYYNPNITDRAEHDKRAEELKRLVGILNSEFPEALIKYEKGFFEPELFLEAS